MAGKRELLHPKKMMSRPAIRHYSCDNAQTPVTKVRNLQGRIEHEPKS